MSEKIAGWRELVTLADLTSIPIIAKLDTGARSSALHAPRLKTFEREGQSWVRFEIRPKQRSRAGATTVELPVVGTRKVTSSNGESEIRPVVRTMCKMGKSRWQIEITLTKRYSMSYRLLLGRSAIRGRFTVSSLKSYLQGP
ncbi:MAG: ATP-dependent zinc protease [Chloroflexi bacterium]|nr:ATP-dependent zinc protease [Chloroflexota bacterium]